MILVGFFTSFISYKMIITVKQHDYDTVKSCNFVVRWWWTCLWALEFMNFHTHTELHTWIVLSTKYMKLNVQQINNISVLLICSLTPFSQIVLKSLPKRIECQEDDDFMAAFDKMIEDTSKARNNESIKVPQFDVPVPVNMKAKKKFGMCCRCTQSLYKSGLLHCIIVVIWISTIFLLQSWHIYRPMVLLIRSSWQQIMT